MSEIPPGPGAPAPTYRRLRSHDGVVRRVRELDPTRVRADRPRRVAPTRYVADRLIVRAVPGQETDDALVAALRAAAGRRGLTVSVTPAPVAAWRDRTLRTALAVQVQEPGDADVDAWELLDEAVAEVGEPEQTVRAGLDHVISLHKHNPGFGVPGSRVPAALAGAAPRRAHADGPEVWTTADGTRRPVVAIVDTGVGRHPWFDGSEVVARGVLLADGAPVGTYDDREPDGDADPRSTAEGTIDEFSGHGTFVAGVVHQTCPDAVLLPVRVTGADGQTTEWDVARSLERLLDLHLGGLRGTAGYHAVDVAVLPFGYYPEDLADDDHEGVLRGVVRDLRRAGVLVVASAGNDGSSRPAVPAAWAPPVRRAARGPVTPERASDLDAASTPLLAVTAANPNGTLAEFANDGAWVTAVRPGANVLSTMPTTFDGPQTPRSRTADGLRESVDPDDFRGGFAYWSGTSFAAPVLAGELAAALLRARAAGGAATTPVRAAWDAVVAVGDLYGAVPSS